MVVLYSQASGRLAVLKGVGGFSYPRRATLSRALDSLLEALKSLWANGREVYKTRRPHSTLGIRTPVDFAKW